LVLTDPLQAIITEPTVTATSNQSSLLDTIHSAMAAVPSERHPKLLSNCLLTGGALPAHIRPHLARALGVSWLEPGIEGRQVAWKGGAVMAKIEGSGEWGVVVGREEWEGRGVRVLAERLPFPL
jgi:actin-related protein